MLLYPLEGVKKKEYKMSQNSDHGKISTENKSMDIIRLKRIARKLYEAGNGERALSTLKNALAIAFETGDEVQEEIIKSQIAAIEKIDILMTLLALSLPRREETENGVVSENCALKMKHAQNVRYISLLVSGLSDILLRNCPQKMMSFWNLVALQERPRWYFPNLLVEFSESKRTK
jgi:hypothetical protein